MIHLKINRRGLSLSLLWALPTLLFTAVLAYTTFSPTTLWASHLLPEKPIPTPPNLEAGLLQIDQEYPEMASGSFKLLKEEELSEYYQFALGEWIRGHWKLASPSPLTQFFNQKGLSDPEWMVRVIVVSYHRHLNHQPIRLEEQIQFFRKNGDKIIKEEAEQVKKTQAEVVKTIDSILEMNFSRQKLLDLFGGGFNTGKGSSDGWISMEKKGDAPFKTIRISYEQKKPDRFSEVYLELDQHSMILPKDKILAIYGKYPKSEPQPAPTLSSVPVSYLPNRKSELYLDFNRTPDVLEMVIIKDLRE